MYKYQFILIFITIIFTDHLQAQSTTQKQQGLLWEISGNGTSAPSYLYGTMHVSKKIAFNLSDTFFLGLKKADKIALESDPSTWMDDFGNMAKARRANAGNNRNYYNNFYADGFILNKPDKQTYQYFLATDNTQINQMLYRISGDEDFQENTYLDLFIYQAAKRSGKDVVALEDNIETLRLLTKAAEPEEDKDKKKKSYSNYSERASRATIEDAYRQGDLTLLDSLNKTALPSKKYYHYFIEERNIIMANGMDSLMQNKTTLFTGVGAAHLPGELGMIKLLQEKGYTVRPVVFTTSSKTSKMKSKIEKTFVSNKIDTRYTSDSIFQVDLPGKLYPTKIYPDYDQYLYPDVANGSFYSLARVKTYTTVLGQTPQEVLQSVDSLLFENIPGDIEKKNEITLNGYPGYDIVNKTRVGNYQRYRIIATPLELFVFKAGGSAKYVLGTEVNKIFNSIKISYSNQKKYTAPSGLWSIMSYPQHLYTNYDRSLFAHFELFQAYDPKTNNWQMVQEGVLHDMYYIEEDTFELAEITRQFAKELGATACEYEFTKHQGKYPALVATIRKDSCTTAILQTKTIIKGSRYYLAASTDIEGAGNFFKSLVLNPITYSQLAEELVDTNLLFSVKTILPPKPTVYQELAQQSSNYYLRQRQKENNFDADNPDGHTKYRTFKVDTTSEIISVYVQSFDKYESEEEADFWEDQNDRLMNDDQTLYILERQKKKIGKRITRDLVIADSTSSRRFLVKEILQNGLYYSLITPTDSIDGVSSFVTEFYNTFQPKDTLIRQDIFVSKGLQLLNDLYSDDSLTLAHAKEASQKYIRADFKEEDKDSILAFVNHYPFSVKELATKVALIKRLGYLDDPTLTKDLLALYKNSEGKTSIELACLQALATRTTKKDYLALKKLMATGDLPLPFYEQDLNSIFYQINDSLELATYLFPDLYLYLSYPEYKGQIFELLANIVHQNKADTSIYANQKRRLIREGINSLKRQLAGDEKKSTLYFDLEYGYDFNRNQVKSTVEKYYDDFLDASSFDHQIGNENSAQLLTFSKLLFPLQKEPLAKKYFFPKLFSIKNGILLYGVAHLALEKEITVPDSLWTVFAKEAKTCIPTYIRLKEANKLELFDTTYANQEHFICSILDLEEDEEENKKEEADSLVFLEKKWIDYQGVEGYLYFYKHKKFENDYWTLNYAGLMPKDSTELLPVKGILIKNKNLIIKKDKEVEELIDDEIQLIQKKKRKRIKAADSYGRYDYGY